MKIARVTDPVPVERQGIRVTFRVSLSTTPDQSWCDAFAQASPSTSKAVPIAVRFDDTDPHCEFDSTEEDLEHWMLYFDKWIEHANSSTDPRARRDW